MRLVGLFTVAALAVSPMALAQSETCESIAFSKSVGELYLQAEKLLDDEKAPLKALNIVERIDPTGLNNCQVAAIAALERDITEAGRAQDLDQFAQPLEPIEFILPDIHRGPSAVRCDTVFDVSATGKPENIRSDCSYGRYNSSARRSVSRARFAPKIVNGTAVPRKDVRYNIGYQLASR